MLKRSLGFIMIFVCVLCLSSCGSDKATVKIEGERIALGVYNYFYAEAPKDSEDREKAAEYLCKKYIAAGRLMEKEGVTLSTNLKRQAAEETEKLWSMFSAYYEGIDVTKQDIASVKAYEMSKKALLHFYYGAGSKGEVSQEKLRSEFAEKYVGFKAVEASFMKLSDIGESVEMSEREKNALRKKLKAMAEKVNSGADIDSVNESYNESLGLIVTQPLSLNVIKENDPLYSESFFSQVKKLSYGQAAVIESGSSIYMLRRIRIDSDDETFSLYANEVLENMKMAKVEKKIEKIINEEL
ncbi:MAG: hypothetical protein IKB94_08285 [Clostridia bacterium]|nr:hypothetical protein [Clostridia bacterium]